MLLVKIALPNNAFIIFTVCFKPRASLLEEWRHFALCINGKMLQIKHFGFAINCVVNGKIGFVLTVIVSCSTIRVWCLISELDAVAMQEVADTALLFAASIDSVAVHIFKQCFDAVLFAVSKVLFAIFILVLVFHHRHKLQYIVIDACQKSGR